MTIKKILAPVSGGRHDSTILALAFKVASQFDAHVEVLFARMEPAEAVPMVGEGVSGTIIEQLMDAAAREWSQREAEARRTFETAVAASGLAVQESPPGPGGPSTFWHSRMGREDWVVPRLCPLSDLVVLGLGAGDADELLDTSTFEASLINGGRPVLLAPTASPLPGIGRVVAIGWNGGVECSRAVSGAFPFLRRAERVVILSIAGGRTDDGRAEALAGYLAWHGIAAEPRGIDTGTENAGRTLLDMTGAVGADLLVIGGYGHSRVRELILGGVTRFVLTHAGLPVLMAH